MGNIHYRAVHTRAPWRKVENHQTLTNALHGPKGARSLLSGRIADRITTYGPANCVIVWQDGSSEGTVLRRSRSGNGIDEANVPLQTILRFESQQGVSQRELDEIFAGQIDRQAPRPQVDVGGPTRDQARHKADEQPRPAERRTKKNASTDPAVGLAPTPRSLTALEELGRVRLSRNFFLREFLHSEISQIYGLANIPDYPELAIAAGSRLCQELLEPIQDRFGRIAIRSAFRSSQINEIGNRNGHNCASNERNNAAHIWDRRDQAGRMGATACIVVPALLDYVESGGTWTAMAWWIHDHLPYSRLHFFPRLCAFNIQWREEPERVIGSYADPRGTLTRPGAANHCGDHSEYYRDLLAALEERDHA